MNEGTTIIVDMLDKQIKECLEDIEVAKFTNGGEMKPLLEKLRTLCSQKDMLEKTANDQVKTENEAANKAKELDMREKNDELKIKNDALNKSKELELKEKNDELLRKIEEMKVENDTAIKIRELELKEKNDESLRKIEEKKIEEQKKNNTLNVIIAGVGAITGIASLIATVFMFKKGLTFEETGSYTAKTVQNIGNVARIVKH